MPISNTMNIHVLGYIYEVEYFIAMKKELLLFVTTWMNHIDTMLREIETNQALQAKAISTGISQVAFHLASSYHCLKISSQSNCTSFVTDFFFPLPAFRIFFGFTVIFQKFILVGIL